MVPQGVNKEGGGGGGEGRKGKLSTSPRFTTAKDAQKDGLNSKLIWK